MIKKQDETHLYLSWGSRSFITAPSSKILAAAVIAIIASLIISVIASCFVQMDIVVKTQGQTDSLLGTKFAVSLSAGQVDELQVQESDSVTEGQIIGHIRIDGTSEKRLRELITQLNKKIESCESTDCASDRDLFEAIDLRESSIKEPLAEANKRLNAYYYAMSEMKSKTLAELDPLKNRQKIILGKLKFLESSSMKKYLLLQKESLEEEDGRITQQITNLENQINERIHAAKEDATHALRIAVLNIENFIARHQIKAPISGRVARVSKSQGSFVTVHEQILSIVPKSSPMVAKVMITSKDLAKVTQGNKVYIGIDAFPTHRFGYFAGKVLSVNSVSENEKEGEFFLARISIDLASSKRAPASEIKLVPGMKVQARIVTKRVPIIHVVLDKIIGEGQ